MRETNEPLEYLKGPDRPGAKSGESLIRTRIKEKVPAKWSSSRATRSSSKNSSTTVSSGYIARRRTPSRSSGRSRVYDRHFQQHLEDNDILPPSNKLKPANWKEINRHLAEPRSSLSPSRYTDEDFEELKEASERHLHEQTAEIQALPKIQGEINFPAIHNVIFNILGPLIPAVDLACAKPDAYHESAPKKTKKNIWIA